jgi:tetratricopeptide (TPR) repeat protein/TolB-like protein
MIGKTISHYEILDKLGEGGMGVVYKALDTKLDRTVALKFLPQKIDPSETDTKRFIHEARTASALDHANICSIYEIDETEDSRLFIVMPAYDGETLRQKISHGSPLRLDEAIDIAIQLADGLQAAHEKRIIHRDIKSSNIFVTHKGQVKIMDFGLARSVGMTQMTKTGITVGTVPYMSPEQARGEQVDHRTDIWSAGVVLYEMITGRLPFRGEYAEAVVYQLLNEDPEPVTSLRSDVPMELERIINKAMRREKTERYQHVDEMLTDLRTLYNELKSGLIKKIVAETNEERRKKVLSRTIVIVLAAITVILLLSTAGRQIILDAFWKESIPSDIHIAVLPFRTIGDHPADRYLSYGLTDILTSKITQMELTHGSFWVVPSSEISNRSITSAREAHRAFGVTIVVDGSVYRDAQAIYVTLNLINGRTLRQFGSWNTVLAKSDLTDLSNIMIVQIGRMLDLELQPRHLRMIARGGTPDPRAYELYIEARGLLHRYDKPENILEAITRFSAAIELDDEFALAYAGLGEAYWRMYDATMDSEWVEQAIWYSERSIELDDNIPSVYITLGMIQTGRGRYEDAMESYRRALEIDPVNSDALNGLARSLEGPGKFDEAESVYKQAITLRPSYWDTYNKLGKFYIRLGRLEEAIAQYYEVLRLTPDNVVGYNNLGAAYYFMGDLENAQKNWERTIVITPDHGAASNLATIYYVEGRYAEAARMYETALKLMDTDYMLWGNLGSAYYWAPGEREKARDVFTRAIEMAEEAKNINPHNPRIIINLAGYHAMIGNRDQAVYYINRAISIAPDDKDVLYRAGTAYERLGERDEALRFIERALSADYPLSDILPQPELQDLIADDRFQKIIERRQD